MKRVIGLSLLSLAVVVLVAPGRATAQSVPSTTTPTTTTTTSTPRLPQTSLVGGANAPPTPGSRISTAIGTHTSRMGVLANPQAGVTFPTDTSTPRHVLLLNDVLTSLFTTLQQLANELALAAGVSGATTTGT